MLALFILRSTWVLLWARKARNTRLILGTRAWTICISMTLIMLLERGLRLYFRNWKSSFLISSMWMIKSLNSFTCTKISGERLYFCRILTTKEFWKSKILASCLEKWYIEKLKKFKVFLSPTTFLSTTKPNFKATNENFTRPARSPQPWIKAS